MIGLESHVYRQNRSVVAWDWEQRQELTINRHKTLTPWKESYDQPRQHVKKQRRQGYGFSSSHVWMWELDHKKSWALKNWCFWTVVLGEDSWESLELQGDPTSPSKRKSVLSVHWEDWCPSWTSNTLATWYKELTHLKRPWCWERLRAGGEGDDRGWDGWMASPTQWVNSWSWWWTGRPGMLWSTGLQRVRHDWHELNWTDWGTKTFFRL